MELEKNKLKGRRWRDSVRHVVCMSSSGQMLKPIEAM